MELDLEIRPQEFTQFTLVRNTECIYRLFLFTPKLCTLITSFTPLFLAVMTRIILVAFR